MYTIKDIEQAFHDAFDEPTEQQEHIFQRLIQRLVSNQVGNTDRNIQYIGEPPIPIEKAKEIMASLPISNSTEPFIPVWINNDEVPVIIEDLTEVETKLEYATEGSAAVDIRVNFAKDLEGLLSVIEHTNCSLRTQIEGILEQITIFPNGRCILPTGFKMQVPVGKQFSIRPRSGLATKGLQVTNSPGTIDSDYRGEVKLILNNTGNEPIVIKHWDRVAQGLLENVIRMKPITGIVDMTKRGEGGLGHTGTK